MKLFRFGDLGNEKPGVLMNDQKLDVSSFGEDYNELFFHTNGLDRLTNWLVKNKDRCASIGDNIRTGSCVARPSKIICVGLNYTKHVHETNADIPEDPIIFFKSTTALCGPYDNVIIPKNSVKTVWEV